MVLLVAYSGAFGGAERLLVELASGLEGERCVACPPGPLADAAIDRGVRVFPLRDRSLALRARPRDRVRAAAHLAGHALELRALVRNLDPDLVVAWGMRSAIAATGARVRYVFQHNDLLTGSLIGALVRAAARRAERVIAPSEAVAAELGLGAGVVVVHPGVDVDSFPEHAAPARPPEVLVLGALVGWKRPDLALEACAMARRRVPDLRLRFVGAPLDGDRALLDRLRTRACQPDLAGAVELAGFDADPGGALARATCLLHCAPREPFGLAVLEALAAARPAVVPAAAGPAEIVDESCGVLYPPGDPAAAADALVEVVSDPVRAAEMGSSGRARARERFDAAAARTRFAEVLAGAARARRPPAPESLALVTVTHNSAAHLEALLGSVERHLPGVRVVVVDCASADQTVSLARRSESVRAIPLSSNIGFGAACNRGVASIAEAVTILVNPDVELLDDSLLALAAEAARPGRPDRLLAPLVLSPDGSRQDTVHPLPASLADGLRLLIPPALVPGTALAPWGASGARRVGWAVGCAIAARTETLRRLGPFDERIFLYGEDLDLGLRAAELGVETWFWPAARVLHHAAHSTGAAFGGEPFELLARARRDVVMRRLGARRAGVDQAAQAATFASRVVAKPLLGRSAARERAQLRALWRPRRSSDARS